MAKAHPVVDYAEVRGERASQVWNRGREGCNRQQRSEKETEEKSTSLHSRQQVRVKENG